MVSRKVFGVVVLVVLAVLFVDMYTGRGISGFVAGQEITLERWDAAKPPKEPRLPKKAHFSLDRVATNKWMDVYGNLSIGGEPAQAGDEVAVFDPDGVLCGVFRVRTEGVYGFLHIYGDDSLSPKDEGAVPGDMVTFRVYDLSQHSEIGVNTSISWSSNNRVRVDISA